MNTPNKNQEADDFESIDPQEDEVALTDDLEDDGTPVLDEADLEENDLTEEEAEDIEWEDGSTAEDETDEEDI
jgi:hypothetical protein